jgi:ferredoxin-NADP reductase
MRITVKSLGDHSASLARLRPGTRVFAEGPYGAMTAEARRKRKVLLMAGGVGITPLRALFQTVHASPGDLTLVYRARSEQDLVFREELQALAKQRSANLHFVVGSRTELGRDPLSAAALRVNVPDLPAHEVYLCGPPGMTEAVRRALRAAGVPQRQIHSESFEL